MKVLILTVPTGGGHMSTGRAIEKYLSERGHLPVNMARIFNFVKIGD